MLFWNAIHGPILPSCTPSLDLAVRMSDFVLGDLGDCRTRLQSSMGTTFQIPEVLPYCDQRLLELNFRMEIPFKVPHILSIPLTIMLFNAQSVGCRNAVSGRAVFEVERGQSEALAMRVGCPPYLRLYNSPRRSKVRRFNPT